MKKKLFLGLGCVAVLALTLGAGYYLGRRSSPAPITIVKEVQGPTVYKTRIEKVQTSENFEVLYRCYESPILIDTALQKNMLYVTAHDECKKSTKEVELEVQPPASNWKLKLAVGGIAGVALVGGGIYTGIKISSLFK